MKEVKVSKMAMIILEAAGLQWVLNCEVGSHGLWDLGSDGEEVANRCLLAGEFTLSDATEIAAQYLYMHSYTFPSCHEWQDESERFEKLWERTFHDDDRIQKILKMMVVAAIGGYAPPDSVWPSWSTDFPSTPIEVSQETSSELRDLLGLPAPQQQSNKIVVVD